MPHCKKCKQTRTADEMLTTFQCKECRKQYLKEYTEKNRAANAERQRKWRAEHPDKNYQKVKEWRENNKEKVSQYNKEYYQRRKRGLTSQRNVL